MLEYDFKTPGVSVNNHYRVSKISGNSLLRATAMFSVLACLNFPLGNKADAATFNASNETEFRDNIINANNSADPSSTIVLLADIAIADPAVFTTITKPLVINTGSFTLSGAGAATAVNLSFSGSALTFTGKVTAGSINAANSNAGGSNIYLNGTLTSNAVVAGGVGGSKGGGGGDGLRLTNASLTNTSAITGGNGGTYVNETTAGSLYARAGGSGVNITGGNLDNQGTIIGGIGGGFSGGNRDNKWAASGGTGAILSGGVHNNVGTIRGGGGGAGSNQGSDTGNGDGGAGLNLSGGAKLTNSATGVIGGSSGRSGGGGNGGSGGGDGVIMNGSTLINYGSVTGGNGTGSSSSNGAFAITATNSIIINAGVITGGKQGSGGQEAAISLSGGNNRLELWAGSAITGNVLASTGDTLALGGAVNSSFNTSLINSNSQYRGFGVFEKTGASTWTLTGTTPLTTPWTIRDGVLQISIDAQLGATAGALTFAGGTLSTTASIATARSVNLDSTATILTAAGTTLTMNSVLSGPGGLNKGGTGALVLAVPGTIQGNVGVNAGTLVFAQAGTFQIGGNYITQAGNTTSVGQTSSLVITGSFTQATNSTLTFDLGAVDPIISASSVTLGGDLVITSLNSRRSASTVSNRKITLIRSAAPITGDFDSVDISAINIVRDYVTASAGIVGGTDYDISLQLTWLTGAATGHGNFTLATGDNFDVDVQLADRTVPGGFASGWDGRSLYKKGDGTLTLSVANDYSGITQVSGGTLLLTANKALGRTGDLEVQTGVVDLSGTSQLSGALHTSAGSRLLFNGGTLTITDAQRLPGDTSGGMIENDTLYGPGSLVIDPSIMPVNGIQSGFTGTATVAGGSTLVLNNAAAFSSAVGAGGLAGIGINLANSTDTLIFGDLSLHTASTVTGITSGVAAMVIAGTGQVQVVDGMNVALGGNNLYTGGTSIDGTSVLQLGYGAGGSLSGWITGNVVNEGTFIFNRADANVFTGVISGTGSLLHAGTGITTLAVASTYSGTTSIQAGILAAGAPNIFSTVSDFSISAAGELALSGFSQTLTSLDNAGMVNFDGSAGTTLTVGAYASNGGALLYSTLSTSNPSATDKLIADSVSLGAGGPTRIFVASSADLGALTTGDGIEVVHVNGGMPTSATGAFVLGSPVKAGAYEYTLFQNGASEDGNWYLRADSDSPGGPYRPEVPVNMTSTGVAGQVGLVMLGTFEDRTAAYMGGKFIGVGPADPVNAMWGRLFGKSGRVSFDRSGGRMASFLRHGPSYDYDLGGFQAGADIYRSENDSGSRNIAGLYVGVGRVKGRVDRAVGGKAGNTSMDIYAAGAYWTHKNAQGWYIDAVAQAVLYDSIKAASIDGEEAKSDGWGFIGSMEGGYPVALGQGWTVTPQAQLIYQHVSLDKSRDAYGAVTYKDTDMLYGRIGSSLSKDWTTAGGTTITTFASANVWHGFGAKAKTLFNTFNGLNPVPLKSDLGGTWGQASLGLSSQISHNVNAFGSIDYSFSVDGNRHSSVGGKVGVVVNW